MRRLYLLVSLLLLLASPVAAQVTTAGITGFVTDPTGAFVPGARITVTNDQTGFTRSTTTAADGSYALSSLPLGTYTITAELSGFKKYVRTGFGPLSVGEVARGDIRLEVGAVTEQVNVTAEVQLVRTTTSETSMLVGGRELAELPLNGRNPFALVNLYAGAAIVNAPTYTLQMRSGGQISVNGSRLNQSDFLFDGAHFVNNYFNTPLAYPPPDSLAEFRLITHSYNAEFGRNAGSIMNAVTKSGTNQFHGSLWEFHRNTVLNARNFFASKRPKLIQNQFGATAGGPIVKDRVFFFGSWQSLRIREQGLASGILVPTAQERQGIFPTAITDPDTGQPFANNTIPPERLNPVAMNVINTYLPLPGPDGTYSELYGVSTNTNQYMGKVDWDLSSSDRVSVRWMFDGGTRPDAGPISKYYSSGNQNPLWNVTGHYTKNFGSNLLNDFLFSYNWNRSTITDGTKFTAIDLGVDPSFGIEGDPVPPFIYIAGRNIPLGGAPGFTEIAKLTQFRDVVTWIRGKHTFKFGGEFTVNNYHNRSQFPANGWFQFTGLFTGNSMADFMLGRVQQLFRLSKYLVWDTNYGHYYFIQDDFKVSPKLTLNLGFRYEMNTPFSVKGGSGLNEQAVFMAGKQSTKYPQAPEGLVFPGEFGIGPGIYSTPLGNWEPRLGFAYDLFGTGKTVIRAGYGIFSDIPVADVVAQSHFNQPWLLRDIRFDVDFSDPYRGVDPKPYPFTPPNPGEPFDFQLPVNLATTDPYFRDPRVQQWHFTLEQEFVKDWKLELAYVGTVGHHLQWTYEANPARFIPGTDESGNPLSTPGNIDARRVYNPGQIGSVQLAGAGGNSAYHALQATVTKRMSERLYVNAAYTWSRTLDFATTYSVGGVAKAQNPFNLAADRGLSDIHRAHKFSWASMYSLPRFSSLHPAARGIAGGWELSTIFTAGTGTPFTVGSGANQSLDGIGGDRPNLIGDPYAVARSSRQDKLAHFLNGAAFELPPIGSYGNLGRNTFIGPGFWNVDLGILKNFPFRERYQVQFRGELFNAFNNVNLGMPVATSTSGAFGRIFSAGDPRVAQLALKFSW